MNLEEEGTERASEQELLDNANGLAEMQKAFDEIDKLKNGENTEDDTQEEEVQEPEVAESEEVEENEEEQREEEEEVKKTKEPPKPWKQKKRIFQLRAEKEVLRQENLQLKNMLNESLNSGTYHYSKSAYAELERARESKKKAIEDGDIDSLVRADEDLTKAIYTINDLEKWATNEEQKGRRDYSNDYGSNQNLDSNEHEREVVNDWLEDHPYLNPTSRKYDSQIANKVVEFVNALDSNLINSRNQDVLLSPEYFDTIDNYISKERKKSPSSNAKTLDKMAPVGAVRNSYAASPSSNNSKTIQMTLSADEKLMAENAGISEKEWLRYKLEQQKETQKR